jgi:hypothetical protein
MGKKGKADLNNMSVFTLSRAILSMRMWAGHKMSNAHMFKKGTKVVIPPPSVGLHGQQFLIEESFNTSLEVLKFLKNFRFMFEQVNPCEFAKIIDKRNIVIVLSNRSRGRAPNIRENQL